MTKPAYSYTLQCEFMGWRVLSSTALALDMPADNQCAMNGAIKIATQIMPEVRMIKTFAGGVPDTEYRNVANNWKVFNPEKNMEDEK